MTISENIMNVYEKAIKEQDYDCLRHTKVFLAYMACRTDKSFSELSDAEIAHYMDELLLSDITCDEYSGVDECLDKNYTECKDLFECFIEA